jgi:tight adherence protein B
MRELLYESSWGPIGLALVAGSLVLVAAVVATATPRRLWIRNRLGLTSETEPARDDEGTRGLRARLAFLFGATENAFGERRAWRRIARLLERAGMQLRAVELVYLSATLGLVLALGVGLATGSGLAVVLALVAGALAPLSVVAHRASRRTRAFEEQLPDVLMALSGSLQVGHSFTHGMQTVVDKGQAPASEEFDRALAESRLGRPLDEALADMGERVGSENLRFVLMSVAIQRQVGGSLAGLFDTIQDTIRDRQRFQRKLRALTAMGKASAVLLVALPFVTGGVITLLNAEYIRPLFTTSTGQVLVLVSLALMAVGTLCLRKIVSFKA